MAAATVCGGGRKRRLTAFLHDPSAPPLAPPHLPKRGRCLPSAAIADLGLSLEFDPIDALQLVFPDADPQVLRGYFERSGNILDAAIRGFKDYLASGSTQPNCATAGAPCWNTSDHMVSSEVPPDVPSMNIPTDGYGWAELLENEMSSALDLNDAKNRAFRILELLGKSTVNCSRPDSTQKMREEHRILKQMLGGLLDQNSILKRAFLVQHNRLKDYKDMVQERSQFKEIVEKYQEQIKALEDRNYALSFHLNQAMQQKDISVRRNPDVF